DALRNDRCEATMFHVEASAAMYLDAMAGWYVRSGLRNWYFVLDDAEESSAQLDRIKDSLGERHFGARSVGETIIEAPGDGGALESLGKSMQRAGADLVVLLLPAAEQLA